MSKFIQTCRGNYFNFENPEEHAFIIEEIAHALSHICRYTGHVGTFYSVCQHSYLASFLVPRELALDALLHDASEAYLGDVSTPLKSLLPDYRKIEARVEIAIAKYFGLRYPMPPEVKRADIQLLMTEKRDLMPKNERDNTLWPDVKPLEFEIVPLSPEEARARFLGRYKELIYGV